jgi:hypothetical protein
VYAGWQQQQQQQHTTSDFDGLWTSGKGKHRSTQKDASTR